MQASLIPKWVLYAAEKQKVLNLRGEKDSKFEQVWHIILVQPSLLSTRLPNIWRTLI